MTAAPIFAAAGKNARGDISTGNTNRDGTGTIVDVVTAGASGSRVYGATVKAIGTTTAGIVRLYVHDGSNWRLLNEVLVSAITVSATVAGFTQYVRFPSLFLPSGWKLGAAPHNAESFVVHADYVDY